MQISIARSVIAKNGETNQNLKEQSRAPRHRAHRRADGEARNVSRRSPLTL